MPTSPANDPETEEYSAPQESEPAQDAPTAEEIAALRDELSGTQDRYRRALADLDNYRKRSQRDVEQRVATAQNALLGEWLEVVDSLERALHLEPGDPGLIAVLQQVELVLTRHGVTRMEPRGLPFDPNRYEVVAVQPAPDQADQSVLEVTRSGFEAADGTLLRPAQVIVARHEPNE